MSNQVPEEMLALQVDNHDPDPVKAIRNLKITTKQVQRPKKGEVLIRMEAAPCNPSDLMHLQGLYGIESVLPFVPGREGAGTVVASGGGLLGKLLEGKRVACSAKSVVNGTWAQYCVTDARLCAQLSKDISTEAGAMLFVNPATAYGLMEKARREGHKGAIQTAAASQLGQMMVRLATVKNLPLINIVRREEQVRLLKDMGAEYVFNSTSEDFGEALREACSHLGATIAFEAVGGQMTGQLMAAMPKNSVVAVYGALSNQSCSEIDPRDLIFSGKHVEGFWLKNWIKNKSLPGKVRMINRIQRLVADGTLESNISKRLKLDEVVEGLLEYQANMTKGKCLIFPHI